MSNSPGKNRAGDPNDDFLGWSYEARTQAAIAEIVDDDETISGMARKYGISPNALRPKVHAERARREDRLLEAHEAATVNLPYKVAKLGTREVPDFETFVGTYFGHFICPDCEESHPMPGFHKQIIEALEGPELRNMIMCPPYHGKSTLVTVWRTVWKICQDRNYRLLLVSKARPLAEAFVRQIVQLLTDPDIYIAGKRSLIADFGPFFDKDDRSFTKTDSFQVSGRTNSEKDPTVLAVGLGVQIYGRRAVEVIFDDVFDVESSRNPDRVRQNLEWIDREALSRIGRKSKAIWVGTRVNPGDGYSTLLQRHGYRIIRYSCILDETGEETLWPAHFPFNAAIIKRAEMDAGSWQLIYQNVDAMGSGNSFTEEQIENAKDNTRILGMFDPQHRMFAGLDPAGAGKKSGITAMTLIAVDVHTGARKVIDHHGERSMPSYKIKDFMIDWTARYGIYEWVVESNALQQQIFAQDMSLLQELAKMGARLRSHQTGTNKWDPQHGVESLGPLMQTGLMTIPTGSPATMRTMQPLLQELMVFPLSDVTDRVMSLWFADIGAREHIRRGHLPMFDQRSKNWPARIKRGRRVINPREGLVRNVGAPDESKLPRKLVNVAGAIEENALGQLTRKY